LSRGTTAVSEPEVLTREDGYVLETKTVTVGGKTFRFRELTVSETDMCREAATMGGEYDSIKMIRMMVVNSSIDPVITLEDIEKMPGRVYSHLWQLVNDLNDPDTLDITEGNA
jgi:hypothetical protein